MHILVNILRNIWSSAGTVLPNNWIQRTLDFGLIISSCLLFNKSIKWVYNSFVELYDLFNAVILIAILVLVGERVWNSVKTKSFRFELFEFRWMPMLTMVLSMSGWLIFMYMYHINIVASSFMFSYFFGLFGFYVSRSRWYRILPAFILMVMTLPFGSIMDVYIGFPLRIFSAEVVSNAIEIMGYSVVSSDTIITIESTATQVDFSCSGMKGVWASMIFYFVITWIERKTIGLKWFSGVLLTLGLVLTANLLRIFVLVLLISVFQMKDTADLIHAPLGLIGFAFSCLLTYVFTTNRWKNGQRNSRDYSEFIPSITRHGKWKWVFPVGMLVILIFLNFFSANLVRPNNIDSSSHAISFNWSVDMNIANSPLSENEKALFRQQNATCYKAEFNYKGLSGSLLCVSSDGWRGHHKPEHCLSVSGIKSTDSKVLLIEQDFPLRWLDVNDSSNACYWYQSPNQITDDYTSRIWSEVLGKQNKWVQTTIVFNQEVDSNHPDLIDLFIELRTRIDKDVYQRSNLLTNQKTNL